MWLVGRGNVLADGALGTGEPLGEKRIGDSLPSVL